MEATHSLSVAGTYAGTLLATRGGLERGRPRMPPGSVRSTIGPVSVNDVFTV